MKISDSKIQSILAILKNDNADYGDTIYIKLADKVSISVELFKVSIEVIENTINITSIDHDITLRLLFDSIVSIKGYITTIGAIEYQRDD